MCVTNRCNQLSDIPFRCAAVRQGLLNEHDKILPGTVLLLIKCNIKKEFDLKNSDNESEDSASDSEVESCSDDRTSTRNAEKIDEAYNFIGIRGPLASLYAVRYALLNSEYDEVLDFTKDLLKLNENKVKEPITFVLGITILGILLLIIARYLACLRYRIQSLPERRERRELHADQARIIVSLKSSNFVAILDDLDKKWGRPMPEALYSDEIVCGMLVRLEDSMFANFYIPKSSPLRIFDLDWSANAPSKALPLPILGLDFTLTFYFPTTPINLSNIRKLSLNSWPITGIYHFTFSLTKFCRVGYPECHSSSIFA